jgi:hypothetical protein
VPKKWEIAAARKIRAGHDLPTICQYDGVVPHNDCVGAPGICGVERSHDVFGLSHVEKLSLETQRRSHRLELFPLRWDSRIVDYPS